MTLTTEHVTSEKNSQKPWTGHLNVEELSRPGGALMAALMGCAEERGQTQQEVAEELGFVYSYLQQLRSGTRKVSSISADFSHACADYLGIPRLKVLVMAGQITAADMFDPGETF